MRRLFVMFAALVALPAHAHSGRFPETQQLLFEGDALVGVASTVGLLVPSEGRWRWTCRAGIGLRLQEDPVWARVDGRFVVASFDGIVVGEPCAFEYVPELRRQAVLDVHVAADGVLFAITSNGAGPNALWRSDDGVSWSAIDALALPTLYDRVRTAPSDPRVIYVSGFVPPEAVGERRTAIVRVSEDGGASFVERSTLLEDGELSLLLLEVDATDPRRVLAHARRDPARRDRSERLLESRDGGATWETRFEVPLFGGFARAGDVLFVGGRDPGEPPPLAGPPRVFGIWRAREGEAFGQVFADAQVKCLHVQGDALYACLGGSSAFQVGRSRDEGRSFEPVLRFDEIAGPASCEASAPTFARCSVEEDDHNREHFGLLDAGAPDAGSSGGGGGCSVGTTGTRGLGLVATLLFAARRRSRSKRPS